MRILYIAGLFCLAASASHGEIVREFYSADWVNEGYGTRSYVNPGRLGYSDTVAFTMSFDDDLRLYGIGRYWALPGRVEVASGDWFVLENELTVDGNLRSVLRYIVGPLPGELSSLPILPSVPEEDGSVTIAATAVRFRPRDNGAELYTQGFPTEFNVIRLSGEGEPFAGFISGVIPEPSSYALGALALLGLFAFRRRR